MKKWLRLNHQQRPSIGGKTGSSNTKHGAIGVCGGRGVNEKCSRDRGLERGSKEYIDVPKDD
jgi:hypothetical protein